MDRRYKGLVIGCGKVGATFEMDSGLLKPASHAAALKANPRTELVGLVDPDQAQLARATDYYGAKGYKDAREAIVDLKPDIVTVSTPPGTHEEYVVMCVELGVPVVVCEKPVAETLEAAQRMIEKAKGSQTKVIVNHQRRFFGLYKEAREKIATGELGRIQQVSAYYSNGFFNNGTHALDAVRFLLSDDAAWAIGVENPLNTTAPFGTNIDALVGFSKGAVAAVQSFDNAHYSPHEIRIMGEKGALIIPHHGFVFEYVPVKEGVTFAGMKELDWDAADVKTERRSMLEGTIAHAIECREGAQPQSSLEDGYKTMQALEAVARSAKEGSTKITI